MFSTLSLRNVLKRIKKNNVDVFSLLTLVGILFLFLAPSFIMNDFAGDFIGQEVPWYHFTFVNLKHGIIPFWSPYAFSGLPYLFKPELSFFHPLAIFTFILDFIFNSKEVIGITGQLMEFVSTLSLCIGAAGMYILSRKIFSLSPIPALFTSTAYVLNPFTLFEIHSTSVLDGVNLLPWLIFSLVRFIEKKTFSSFFFLVVCNYLLLLGYSYHYVYFFLMQVGLVVFYGLKKLFLFLLSFLTSVALSGFFLLPYLDIYSQSARNTNNYDVTFHTFASLSPVKILEIINPVTYNSVLNPTVFPSLFGGPTLTWGSFAFVFLLFGLGSLKKTRISVWIVGVLLLSFFYSFGGNLESHTFFGTLVPLIYKFRFHARAFICTIFAGALLIGFGAQAMQDQKRVRFIEFFLWTGVLVFVVGLLLGQLFFTQRIIDNIDIFKGTMISLIFLTTSLLITALTSKFGKKGFLIIGLVIMLLEYNLFFHNLQGFFTKNISYDQFYRLNSLIPEVPTDNNLFRMYFEDDQFAYNTSVFKIYNMNGYENSPYPSWGEREIRYGQFRFYQVSNLKYVVTTTDNWQLGNPDVIKIKTVNPLTLPNESYFHSPDKPHFIYEIKNYLPRFFIPHVVVPCEESLCLSKDQPPKLVVAKGLKQDIRNPSSKKVTIHVDTYTTNAVDLSIKTPQKTFVASSETWDRGWSIIVNGKPSVVYDTSNGTRGFIVPSGQSIVHMEYFPPTFLLGVFVTLSGISFLFAIWRFRLLEYYARVADKIPFFKVK